LVIIENENISKIKQETIETLDDSGKPDRELFSQYFSLIKLEETTLLPIGETNLECGFNKKQNFEFIYTVFNLIYIFPGRFLINPTIMQKIPQNANTPRKIFTCKSPICSFPVLIPPI
jgi:hypothetical protein